VDQGPQGLRGRNVALWLLMGASLVGYVAISLWFPLQPYHNISPSPDLRYFAPSLPAGLAYGLLIILLFGLYGLAYRQVRSRPQPPTLAAIVATAGLLSLPLLFAFPINATDVYRYFIRGRITSVHHQDPFSVAAAELTGEPYLPLAGEWAGETSPYGPVWELTAAAVTAIVPDNLYAALLIFKGLATSAHLLVAVLIWRSLAGQTPRIKAAMTLLWAYNPALLLIFALNGHNDGLMIVWLLLGWWLMTRGRLQAGMLVMLLAPLTKPIGLLPLPYFFVFGWRQLPRTNDRIRYLLLTALAGLALAWLAFLPFGDPLSLAQRLVSETGSGGGFSPLAMLILVARGLGTHPSIDVSVRLATALFAAFALWLLWQTWRGRHALRAAADILAGYIFQAFRFRICYASWPFPWLVLDYGRLAARNATAFGRLVAGLFFLMNSQLSVVIYGQIRTELLNGSQLAAHLIGIPFTFLLPIAAGLAGAAYYRRQTAGEPKPSTPE
jgi:hypothetical protein